MFKFMGFAVAVAALALAPAATALACGGCGGSQAYVRTAPSAVAQAPSGRRTYRSYSYEPSYERSAPAYRGPSRRGMRSQTPSFRADRKIMGAY